jgi:hypothetical protein
MGTMIPLSLEGLNKGTEAKCWTQGFDRWAFFYSVPYCTTKYFNVLLNFSSIRVFGNIPN